MIARGYLYFTLGGQSHFAARGQSPSAFPPHKEPIAIGYWTDIDGNIPNVKGFMKKYMKEFPTIVQMINDGELTPERFRNNPAIVLPIMDSTYSE